MKVDKRITETYIITDCNDLDAITLYVTNYELGQGKIVIECFGNAWSHYWPAMGNRTLQEFVLQAHNEYIINKMIPVSNLYEINFDEVNKDFKQHNINANITCNEELYHYQKELQEIYEDGIYLPQRKSNQYNYLDRIINVIKDAFKQELGI